MHPQFRVAGITIELVPAEATILPDPQPPFAAFFTKGMAPDLTLHIRHGEPFPRGEQLFDSGEVWQLSAAPGGGLLFEFHSDALDADPYKSLRVDRDLREGEVVMHTRQPLNPLEFPLDEVLINQLLARRGGVELHGCGVIDDGRGILFAGQSGAGKTTTARLWHDRPVVSDDRVIVTRDARHERGPLMMHGTPWHGEAELSSPDCAPLAAIYLLVQAGANAIVPLTTSEAAARLFTCSFPPLHDPAAVAQALEFLGTIAETVPVSELRFVPDRSAVDLVRQQR